MAFETHELGAKLVAQYRELIVHLRGLGDEPECIEVTPWELDAIRAALWMAKEFPHSVEHILGVPVVLIQDHLISEALPEGETFTRGFMIEQSVVKEYGWGTCLNSLYSQLDTEFGAGCYEIVDVNHDSLILEQTYSVTIHGIRFTAPPTFKVLPLLAPLNMKDYEVEAPAHSNCKSISFGELKLKVHESSALKPGESLLITDVPGLKGKKHAVKVTAGK